MSEPASGRGRRRERRGRRSYLVVALATIAVAASTAAFAASLGGIEAGQLGADTQVITSCDTDGVSLAFEYEYSTVQGEYVVTEVNLDDVAAECDGHFVVMWLVDSVGLMGQQVGQFDSMGGTNDEMNLVLFDFTPPAESVERALVFIQSEISPYFLP